MRGLFSDVSQISTLRSVGVFAGVFLSLVAGITPGHCGALNNSSDIVYDFHQGLLEWSGEWDTDAGQDSYSDYYRVDRLRGGYVIRDHSSFCTGTAHDYFLEQVDQIIRPYSECGFWDDEHGNWVRKLLWSETSGWCGMVPHDWKYSLELEEGALMAAMISGVQSMNIHCAGELEYVHAYLNPDGSIDDLILEDNPCEYGLALSSLALGARLFAGQMIVGYDAIGEQAYEDMILVHRHIGKNLVVYDKPSFNTGYILKGLVNAYLTYREHS
ncbi:MAG: hypothetical protein KOO63_06325, partial [Bacteroidales bacterium]|nr:hypothetical protein [Candidatus Latescibacterota bacterium]